MLLGKITIQYNGYAIDSTGKVYVGTDYTIQVYENGVKVNEITAKDTPGGAYDFTVEEDKIVVCKNVKIYTLDLNGNLLDTVDDEYMKKSNEIQKGSFYDIVSNGDRYSAKRVFGYYLIIKTDSLNQKSIVFKMPIFDYLLKVILIACCSIILVLIISVLSKFLRTGKICAKRKI